MPELTPPGVGNPMLAPRLTPTAGSGWEYSPAVEAVLDPETPAVQQVGWSFISRYTLAYMGTCLLFLAPVLVTLALKVNSLVGIERAPKDLASVFRHQSILVGEAIG